MCAPLPLFFARDADFFARDAEGCALMRHGGAGACRKARKKHGYREGRNAHAAHIRRSTHQTQHTSDAAHIRRSTHGCTTKRYNCLPCCRHCAADIASGMRASAFGYPRFARLGFHVSAAADIAQRTLRQACAPRPSATLASLGSAFMCLRRLTLYAQNEGLKC